MDVDVLLTLPKEIAEQAQAEGLLAASEVAGIFERELERRHSAKSLLGIMDALQSLEPRLTEEEIEAELAQAKAERMAASEHRRADRD